MGALYWLTLAMLFWDEIAHPSDDNLACFGPLLSAPKIDPVARPQCVAGGQPVGLSLQENVEKECIEEANIPAELARTARPSSAVKYMYETRKGMSPKTLYCYDLEVPEEFVPENTDGEVESFVKVGLGGVIESLSQHPEDWKPNSALVCLDFAIR